MQNLSVYPGKLLHLDRDGNGLSSNPYWDINARSIRSRIYASGFRNPFRLSIEPDSNTPYIADVGWSGYEEINRVTSAGNNFGWPCYEGAGQQSGYAGKAACQTLYAQGSSAITPPWQAWDHSGGGGAAIRGAFGSQLSLPAPFDDGYQ